MKAPTLAALVASASLSALATLPKPVTYYSFDEIDPSGKIINQSGNGLDLTLGSGATLTNLAAVGKALWFDGTQSAYAVFAAPAITNRTISFWLYRCSYPGKYYEEHYADESDKSSRMPTFIYHLNTFNLRFNNDWIDAADHSLGGGNRELVAWIGEGGNLSGNYLSYSKYPQVGRERWAHVAYAFNFTKHDDAGGGKTCDTFDATIYVNGEKFYDAKDLTSTNCCLAQGGVLGNVALNGKRPTCGAIDELKVYDSVLTQEQVREEFARGQGATRQRLVVWYPMEEFGEPDAGGNYTTPDCAPFSKTKGKVLTCLPGTCVTNGPNGTDKAIHFDGTANTGANGKLPMLMDDFTVSAWVNISTNTSILRVAGEKANYPKLFYVGTCCAYLAQQISNTQMQFTLPSGKGGNNGIHTFVNNAIAGKGNWQHMTWVVRNTRTSIDTVANQYTQHLELYLNGELAQTSVECDAKITAANANVLLGTDSVGSTARPFEGEISDFRIYDGAMSAEDVRSLFRGAAKVEAGEAQTVKGAKAVLCGSVAARGAGIRTGYAGAVSWSLASAPEGGEAAEFLRPSNPVTEVTLPVEGAYVFRLKTVGAYGAESEDTVTVTRDDATGIAPLMPAVDVDAVVSNAAVCASLTNGLIRHWSLNGRVWSEEITKTVPNPGNNWSIAKVTDGVTGNGVTVWRGMRGKMFETGSRSGETSYVNGAGCPPDNEWLTVSAWIKPESDYPADWFAGVICHIPLTLSISYGKWYSPDKASGPIPGMGILQTGIKGWQTWMNFNLPEGANLTDKWSHVLALVNRWQTEKSAFYLNGVRLEEDTAYRCTAKYLGLTEEAYEPFNGKPVGGRDSGTNVGFGNTQIELNGKNNIIYVASNTTTRVEYSRHFPGAVDEVRFYNRRLTEEEIGYLATHPDLAANAAPAVTKAESAARAVRKVSSPAAARAADDGQPSGALTLRWVVLKGDAAQVVFADASARETAVTFLAKGEYTLCLTANDGERTTYGEPVEVTVERRGAVMVVR